MASGAVQRRRDPFKYPAFLRPYHNLTPAWNYMTVCCYLNVESCDVGCLQAWMYVLAELLGGVLAAGAAVVLYGIGPDWPGFHDHRAMRPKLSEDDGVTAFHNEVCLLFHHP